MTDLRTTLPAADGSVLLRRSSLALVAMVWTSTTLFGVYILVAYAGAVADRDLTSWNAVLPHLFDPTTPAATVAIGVHFAAGGLILVLGFVQLIAPLRERHPRVHRVLGRVYVAGCLLAGFGGLGFIVTKGTVGGAVMDVGFGLYGVLVVVCAVETYRHARARRIEQHRAWALRLFALAVGSWLYRMDYGAWILLVGDAGRTDDFRGPFDRFTMFAFYVPNLLVVQAYLNGLPRVSVASRRFAAVVLLAATAFLAVATWSFTTLLWGPTILERLGG